MTSSPPVAKRSILKWIGLAFLLLFGWFLWSLFGPNPPIIVSKQTTYITAPLAADGLPDYEAYLLEEMRKHKPQREDNAAVAMWQAMGPGEEVSPEDWSLLERELGSLASPAVPRMQPSSLLRDPGLEATIADWLDSLDRSAEPEDCEAVVNAVCRRPWVAKDAPPIAAMIGRNRATLDYLRVESARPEFLQPIAKLSERHG